MNLPLPEEFQNKMKVLLESEYDDFIKSYEIDRTQGMRVNLLKTDSNSFYNSSPFHLKKIPWVKEGFFYEKDDRPGKHPCHDAGVYYIQEPSAMAVVELLDPQPGDRVLDLCAAPGGKSTHAAARLFGKGLLVSNEIHPARAKILSQNIERMGIPNAVVTNEDSYKMAEYFPEFFDKIIVDAPCSGEGMFRKDENARNEWSMDNVKLCAKRQQEILDNAASMLKPGGRLVYSTCTFSPEENEASIETFLQGHSDFFIEKRQAYEGFSSGKPEWIQSDNKNLKDTFRLWPHKINGEGHYMAVLKKQGEVSERKRKMPSYVRDKSVQNAFYQFVKEVWNEDEILENIIIRSQKQLVLFGEQLYLLPDNMINFEGLRVLRPGLHLGTIKKNRFEPSHALALYLSKNQVKHWISLKSDEPDVIRYLKGETIPAPEEYRKEKGWFLVLADEYSLGWAKLASGIFKNHYPKGLRWK